MAYRFILALAIFSAVLTSCTTSRWVVVDEAVTNEGDNPSILSENLTLTVEKEPTTDDPTVQFAIQKIVEKEIEQRVMVERTIQKYRPKWGVWAIGLSGAVFAATAANTSMIYPDTGNRDELLLNLTSLLTASMTFSQLKPVGEPISTGETRLMRRSGFEVVSDTLQSESFNSEGSFELHIQYLDSTIVEETNIEGTDGTLAINLASVLSNSETKIDENSALSVSVKYDGSVLEKAYSVQDFMEPYVVVEETIVLLRNAPVLSELNVVGEVGLGSAFELIENTGNGWFRVLFGGSEVFIQENEASVQWLSDATSESIDVFEFAKVPFGEIDVENSVPILRQNRKTDRSLIITNSFINTDEERPYLERDHRLFDFYMEAAMQMDAEQRETIRMDSTDSWQTALDNFAEADSTSLLYVFITGSADLIENELYMTHNKTSDEQNFLFSDFFQQFERMDPEKLIVLADLEYNLTEQSNTDSDPGISGEAALHRAAGRLQNMIPNSAIIFSNRPGQESQIYAGGGAENKRHHIFTYFWADALKKRNTTVSQLLNHLQNNVDYTSRRLHDTPQEIRAFGNLTISVRE
jgi:hypothetical protein